MLVDLVHPLQGTASTHSLSRGNCLPLVARPWGMTHWSPQTSESNWLFHPDEPKLQGVRATHQPSPWIGDYGHFTVMPQTGPAMPGAAARASSYRITDATFRPHVFAADLLRYRTRIEVTATERCGAFRFTFPASAEARVILESFTGESGVRVGSDGRTIAGFTRANNGGVAANFACHYVARFDRPFTRASPLPGERVGAIAEFDLPAGGAVNLRVATSFISVEQAERNLACEVGGRSFDALVDDGARAWDELLSRVELDGATDDQRRTFYTCLWRTLLFPRQFHEPDAAGRPHHYSPYDGQVHAGPLAADNGFWDTYRTVYPMLALIYPDKLGETLQGWVNATREGGWLPKWSSPGYRACMIGTHADAVIADAVVRGIEGFDRQAAYRAMLRDGDEVIADASRFGRKGLAHYLEHGYVPADQVDHGASETLDYAYDDFCIAQVAKALGREDDYRRFAKRALNYRTIYDPSAGFFRARNADGSWHVHSPHQPFDEFAWGGPYVEGGAWQCGWAVQHDPAGMIELMGGPESFVAKLDRMLALPPQFNVHAYPAEIHEMTEMALAPAGFGQYAHSNQPAHHVLYLYAAAGQPWKAQHWVRRVLNEMYGHGPHDGFAGDEDNGEMSAWYVLSALGVFPLCPGHPSYVLGSPLFPRATIRRPGAEPLVIEAEDNAPENVYVQRVELHGAPHAKTWVSHVALAGGGSLRFHMGAVPRTDVRFGEDDLPFSLSRGQSR